MKVLHDIDNDNDCTLTSLITTKFLGSHSSLWRSKHEWWEREWQSSITLTLHFFCGDCDDSGSRIINRGFGLVMGGSMNLWWSHMVTWGFYKSPWVNWSIFFPMYFSQMFTMKPIDETMLRTTPMITENWQLYDLHRQAESLAKQLQVVDSSIQVRWMGGCSANDGSSKEFPWVSTVVSWHLMGLNCDFIIL